MGHSGATMDGSNASNTERRRASKIGRRSAARLRLSVPAKLQTTLETIDCVLLNISQTGAKVALEHPLAVDEYAILKCARLEEYVEVLRCDVERNGLRFDVPLSKEQILAMKNHSEDVRVDERRALRREVKNWVGGGG